MNNFRLMLCVQNFQNSQCSFMKARQACFKHRTNRNLGGSSKCSQYVLDFLDFEGSGFLYQILKIISRTIFFQRLTQANILFADLGFWVVFN